MKASILQLAAALLSGAAALSESQRRTRDLAVSNFEERFLDSLAWQHSNQTVKLVGYMKIRLTELQLADLEHGIRHRPDEWADHPSAFYDSHERNLRVYFPVEGGLMYHGDKLVEATHMGELPHHDALDGDCSVVGRYKTDQVHGVPANRVEDGIIYLANPASPVRAYGEKSNVYVYDFGWRSDDHGHHYEGDDHEGHSHARRSSDEGSGGSCKQNHGGRVCSLVYGINNGRCKRDYSKCIDYNGWPITECSSKSKKGFVGSDCFTAVAEGHCWNEVEAAA